MLLQKYVTWFIGGKQQFRNNSTLFYKGIKLQNLLGLGTTSRCLCSASLSTCAPLSTTSFLCENQMPGAFNRKRWSGLSVHTDERWLFHLSHVWTLWIRIFVKTSLHLETGKLCCKSSKVRSLLARRLGEIDLLDLSQISPFLSNDLLL